MIVQATSQELIPSTLARASQRAIGWLVAHVWYRTAVHGHVPTQGPAILVSLHRCGAVDGWVEHGAIGGDMAFLVGANLRRNPLTRMLAVGIPVERTKDAGDRSNNAAALEAAARWVADGGRLVVYPEGTSDLGPRPLPMHPGAARIVARVLELGAVPAVVPLTVDYDRPDVPGSHVDVVAGPSIPTSNGEGTASIHRKVRDALEALAFTFPDEGEQRRRRYASSLMSMGERGTRLALLRAPCIATRRGPRASGPALACVVIGVLANPPLAALAWWVPRRFADAPNVVPFWRIVPLVFATPAWLASLAAAAGAAFGPIGLLAAPAAAAFGALALSVAPRAFPPRAPSRTPGDDLDGAGGPVDPDDVAVAQGG